MVRSVTQSDVHRPKTSARLPRPAGRPAIRLTSVGSKFLMALSGLALIGFVTFHMLGNLQIYLGQEQLNAYAALLKGMPTLLWTARIGLVAVFVMHIGLLFTPVFLMGHNILLQERWGFSLPTISEATADLLTIAVIVSVVFLVLRRIALTEVRIITNAYDYLVIAIAVAPFVTGLLARYQVGDYDFWLILHILCGEIFLVAIPFTKLSHFILFFASRAQLGMDYGIKRGGMKGKGLAW